MKKLLLRAFMGFSLGISLLMISYLGIYYIADQETFSSSILELNNVYVLQNQLLVVGFAGTIISFGFSLIEQTLTKDKPSPSMSVVSIISLLSFFVISMFLIKKLGNFNDAVKSMLIILSTLALVFYCLVNCIREFVDEFMINRKIKEKNG